MNFGNAVNVGEYIRDIDGEPICIIISTNPIRGHPLITSKDLQRRSEEVRNDAVSIQLRVLPEE